jgi:hypothetical protein
VVLLTGPTEVMARVMRVGKTAPEPSPKSTAASAVTILTGAVRTRRRDAATRAMQSGIAKLWPMESKSLDVSQPKTEIAKNSAADAMPLSSAKTGRKLMTAAFSAP